MFSRATWWGAGMVLVVAACGKSNGSGPVPESELPARLAGLTCESVADCCANANHPFDSSGCQTATTRRLEQQLRPRPRVTYDPSAAGDCLDQLAASLRCGDVSGGGAPACDRIWRGTVALGKPCDSSDQCAPSTFQYVRCSADESTGARTCEATARAPRGRLGEACSYTCPAGASCDAPADVGALPGSDQTLAICSVDDGLFCRAGACARLVELGGACTDGLACRGAAYCDIGDRVCRPLHAEDEPCYQDAECQSRNCVGADDLGGGGHCAPEDVAGAAQCREDFSAAPEGPAPSGL